MDRLQKLITEEDLWTCVEGDNNGIPFLLRFRPHLQDFIDTKKYNMRLSILWKYTVEDSALLPSEHELELMTTVENVLVETLEFDLQSILAFVYTGDNQRVWIWYSNDINEAGSRLNGALSNFDKLPIELSAEVDPDWSGYKAVITGADESKP